MNKTILIVIIVLVVVVGGYFLFQGNQQEETGQESGDTTLGVPAPGSIDVDETIVIEDGDSTEGEEPAVWMREITVIGTEFAFNPSTITAQAGQPVVINFENQGNVAHDLVIEGLGVRTALIGGGQTDSIEFIAPASGVYTIFCSVGSHRSLGMKAVLEVE